MVAQDLDQIDELHINEEEAAHTLAGQYSLSIQALLLRITKRGNVDQ